MTPENRVPCGPRGPGIDIIDENAPGTADLAGTDIGDQWLRSSNGRLLYGRAETLGRSASILSRPILYFRKRVPVHFRHVV